MIKLRPYQNDAVGAIRDKYLNGFRSPLLVLPTGGGKTIIFSYISDQSASRGKRILILVHRIELLRQTQDAIISKTGQRCGLINANYTPDLRAPIQVASVQTLLSRMDYIFSVFKPDLIVIDEAHHALAASWRKIIDANPHSWLLGVTATPTRTDGTGLGVSAGGYFDCMVEGPEPSWLIENGFLVRPRVFGSKNSIDLSDVDMVAGDYKKNQLGKKLDKPTITGDAVEHYSKLCPGDPCVVFCVSVEHAEHVAEQFRSAGYRAVSADGKLDDYERKKRLGGLATGEVQVLTTCDLISEGTDIPAITCAILLRPTASLGLFIQQVGRALRPVYADGYDLETVEGRIMAIAMSRKPFAYILDHVGNWKQHGFPDEKREWSLDGQPKRGKSAVKEQTDAMGLKIKQCPQCFAIHEYADKCPECLYEYPEDSAKPPKQIDGELRELTNEDKELIKRQQRVEVAMAKSFNDLLTIEKTRNYKPGWAQHVWIARGKKDLQL